MNGGMRGISSHSSLRKKDFLRKSGAGLQRLVLVAAAAAEDRSAAHEGQAEQWEVGDHTH